MDIKLNAKVRENKGSKKELSTLRKDFQIPGVVYGGDKPSVKVALSEKALLEARKKGGVNAVLHLDLGGQTETVIVKELQKHPVTERPIHADFQRISLTQKITAKVPLKIIGLASGVKNEGGLLQHELRELTIKALPTKIPQFIELDVTSLNMNEHFAVKDIKVPADLEVLDDAEHLVVHVTTVKVEEAAAAPVAAAAATAEGAAAAPAEPESASTKGKKDEEGKLVKETAKAGAPAAAGDKKEPAKKEGK
jgi:large subunit ribosomal protein L25